MFPVKTVVYRKMACVHRKQYLDDEQPMSLQLMSRSCKMDWFSWPLVLTDDFDKMPQIKMLLFTNAQ